MPTAPHVVRDRHRARAVAMTLAAIALVAAACGNGDDGGGSAAAPDGDVAGAVFAGPAGSAEEGLEGLYEAAVANGEDTVILAVSTTSAEIYGDLAAAFEEQFPEITVELKEMDFIQMGSVVQSELDAGQRTADVVTNAFLALKPMIDAGSIDESIDWSAMGVPDERVAEAGFVFQADGLCTTVVYNPDVIDEADLPDDLEGFLESEWSNQLSTLPSNGVACMGFYALREGLEETTELVEGLRDNGMIFTDDAEQLMLAGERPVIVFHYSITAPRLEEQGAPVAEKLYPGTGVFRTRVAVVEDTPVPNAARLLTAWMVSPEAMEIFEDYHQGGQGFVGDPDSMLVTRTEALGQDPTDETFFVYETIDNFADRAEAASTFRELFVG
ncbi:MAG: extracellular solute-binding protein [Acidimicrobiia bacterium]|nr:extracellular solute-binding protein [Acidimicrobiia bacterium]